MENINLIDIYKLSLTDNGLGLIKKLQELGVISNQKICRRCGKDMKVKN